MRGRLAIGALLVTASLVAVCSNGANTFAGVSRAEPHGRARTGARPAATEPGHLYVSVAVSRGGVHVTPEVERFPFVGARPTAQPDATYEHVTGPLTVGTDGTLYAAKPVSGSGVNQTILIFAPKTTQPTREIVLPTIYGFGAQATGLALDPSGILYVSYFASGDARRPDAPAHRALPASTLPSQGVLEYAPTAHGHAKPLLGFDVPNDAFGPGGLSLNGNGVLDLAVNDTSGYPYVDTIAGLPGNPYLLRVVQMLGNASVTYPRTIGSELYVLASNSNASILVYPHRAQGTPPPLRTIDAPTSAGMSGFAAGGNQLYAAAGTDNAVYGFPKTVKGTPSPYFTLRVAGYAEGVATGP